MEENLLIGVTLVNISLFLLLVSVAVVLSTMLVATVVCGVRLVVPVRTVLGTWSAILVEWAWAAATVGVAGNLFVVLVEHRQQSQNQPRQTKSEIASQAISQLWMPQVILLTLE